MAQMLQADLKKVGIVAKITDTETTVYNNTLNTQRDTRISTTVYGRASRDPGTLVTGALAWYPDSEKGRTRIESDTYNQLRQEMQSTLDQAKRTETARKIQELALDECFNNPVAPNQRPWAYAGYVKGFGYDIDNSPRLRQAL